MRHNHSDIHYGICSYYDFLAAILKENTEKKHTLWPKMNFRTLFQPIFFTSVVIAQDLVTQASVCQDGDFDADSPSCNALAIEFAVNVPVCVEEGKVDCKVLVSECDNELRNLQLYNGCSCAMVVCPTMEYVERLMRLKAESDAQIEADRIELESLSSSSNTVGGENPNEFSYGKQVPVAINVFRGIFAFGVAFMLNQ